MLVRAGLVAVAVPVMVIPGEEVVEAMVVLVGTALAGITGPFSHGEHTLTLSHD